MSFGSYAESSTLKLALENAYHTSILVAASGNSDCIGPCPRDCAPSTQLHTIMYWVLKTSDGL